MDLKELFIKYKKNIEKIEVKSENYYYCCENSNKVLLRDSGAETEILVENFIIKLDGEFTFKNEMENDHEVCIYIYEDFALKITMKRVIQLIELLKYKKSNIQKVEIFGDNFYFSCQDNSTIFLKEDTNPIMVEIGAFILSFERTEVLKGVIGDDNSYVYTCRNFKVKVTFDNEMVI